MKYPPVCSAHWEGAVGQWLRNQLDARGIDAPAYGRYVLSLLTRPLDPADLSPSPIGSKMWERRSQSDWPPVKIEALKRSAAVQCLINASDDQNSGIEQLVDELCMKLKEVEEGKAQTGKKESQNVKSSRRDRSRPISPSEMARMYYAAFPALVPSTSAPVVNPTSDIPQPPPSASGLINNSQRTKDVFTYKCGSNASNKDCSRTKKIGSKERRNTIHAHRSHYRGNNKNKNFYAKSLDQTEELPEWVNDGDVWDIETQDHLQDYVKSAVTDDNYEARDAVYDIPSSKRLYERDSDIYINFDDNDFLFSKQCTTEENFKYPQQSPLEEESMAKFKAKFDSSLEALWPKEQNNNIDYELPMDLNDISSPSDRMFDCYSADKPLPLSLTSSIWSNNESKTDWENNELVLIGDELQPTRRFVPEINELNVFPEKQNNLWPTDTELYNKESMEVIYNKLKPLNLDDSEESSCDIKKTQWFTAAPMNWLNNNIVNRPNSFSSDSHPPIGTPARSFNILNHSSYSSFTEVVPKPTTGYIGDNLRRNNAPMNFDLPSALKTQEDEKEEEDLLTSMKTHFRPIKHDAKECAIVNYADGMTFPVVSDLDYVKFNRSSSGNMFLESETEPPKQYMVYRKQGIDYTRLDIGPSSLCSDESLQQTDLILKFRVCQTEKAIQTDVRDMIMRAAECQSEREDKLVLHEPSPFKVITNLKCNNDTDNELETLNYNWVQCEECKLNNNQWISNNWHPVKANSSKIWSLDDNFCKACSEQQMKVKKDGNNIGKNKMYEEESDRDWDDILSDLKYIRDNDWQDDLKTPSENCYIAPTEISYAIDGNFIKNAFMMEKTESSVIDDVKAWLANTVKKTEINTVGRILDQSVIMYSNVEPHCDASSDDPEKSQDLEGWRMDRKRRHSGVNNGRVKGAGKLRCTLPIPPLPQAPVPLHLPLLPTLDRPLTR